MVHQLLKLLLQGFGALAPEVSLLLTVETMVLLSFGVISHPYGSSIDLRIESQLCIVLVLYRIVIIDVLGDVIFPSLDLHNRLHLCSMDTDISIIVVILLVIMCLVLLCVIWLTLVRVGVVGPIGRSSSRWWVCLCILCSTTPVVLSFILLALTHGHQKLCDADLGVISLVHHHSLVLWMQAH